MIWRFKRQLFILLFSFFSIFSAIFIDWLFPGLFFRSEASPPSPLSSFQKKKPANSFETTEPFPSETRLRQLGRKSSFPSERIKVREDRLGRHWVIEETASVAPRLICFSSSQTERGSPLLIPFLSPASHSVELDFSPANEPWVIWIESKKDRDCLQILSPWFSHPLIIAEGPAFSLTSPTICFDAAGWIWIFWAEAHQGVDRLFCRRLIGESLSPPEMLFPNGNFPCILPRAQADPFGRVWLAWASYDGTDYEIFLSLHQGESWSAPRKITANSHADIFPSFCLAPDGSPLLSWLESGDQEARIWATEISGERLDEPRLIWSGKHSPLFYELIRTEGRLLLLLTRERDFQLFSVPEIKEFKTPLYQDKVDTAELSPILFPGRDDDSYIGFGDSITSGLIKTSLDPEKYYYYGYPPRLELILKETYGVGRVINEGVDGETTPQGVSRISSVLAEYKARYLLLMEGFNDVIFLNISLDTTTFNLSQMIRKSLQAGVLPALATITPRRDWVWYQEIYRERHLALNEKIRQLAPQLGVPLVDQYQALDSYPPEDGGLLSLLSVDLKHPNEKGYQIIAQTWFEEIKAFPFPPRNLSLYRRDFIWDSHFIRVLGLAFPSTQTLALEGGSGNLLVWEANPKIKNSSRIAGYRVYRKKAAENDTTYVLLATIKDRLNYFDKQIILFIPYTYLVSTFRTDGVEGPAAGPITR